MKKKLVKGLYQISMVLGALNQDLQSNEYKYALKIGINYKVIFFEIK